MRYISKGERAATFLRKVFHSRESASVLPRLSLCPISSTCAQTERVDVSFRDSDLG